MSAGNKSALVIHSDSHKLPAKMKLVWQQQLQLRCRKKWKNIPFCHLWKIISIDKQDLVTSVWK